MGKKFNSTDLEIPLNKLTSRQKQAIETKAKIYDCAIELFKQKPYDDIKISEICETAEVSVGMFYYYFENKDYLLGSSYENFEIKLKKILINQEFVNPKDRIIFAINSYMDIIKDRGFNFMNSLLRNELATKNEEIENRFFYNYISTAVKEILESKQSLEDFKEITDDIFKFIKGSIFNWVTSKGRYSIDNIGLNISKYFL